MQGSKPVLVMPAALTKAVSPNKAPKIIAVSFISPPIDGALAISISYCCYIHFGSWRNS